MPMTPIDTQARINQQTGMVMAYYGYDQSKTQPSDLKAVLGAKWINIDNTAQPLNSSQSLGADYNIQKNSSGTVENSFSIYINTEKNQIAIAFKGSDALSNWGSDLSNGGASEFAKIQQQAQAAFDKLSAESAYKDFQFITVGHSLGGGMAQSFGLKNKLDIQVYNSLPIANGTIESYFGGDAAYAAAVNAWKSSGRVLDDVRTPNDIATWYYPNTFYGKYLSKEVGQSPTMLPGAEMPDYLQTVVMFSGYGTVFGLAGFGMDHTMGSVIDTATGLAVDSTTGKFIIPEGHQSFANIPVNVREQFEKFSSSSPIVKVESDSSSETTNSYWVIRQDGTRLWMQVNRSNGDTLLQQPDGNGGYLELNMNSSARGGEVSVVHKTSSEESAGENETKVVDETTTATIHSDGRTETTRTLSTADGQMLERSLTRRDAEGEPTLQIETNAAGEVSTRWAGEEGRALSGDADGIARTTEDTRGTETTALEFLGYVNYSALLLDGSTATRRSGPGGAYQTEQRNAAGQITGRTVIDADGSATVSQWNGSAGSVRRENADGSVVTTVTDSNGTTRDLTTKNADGSSGYWVYDAQGRLQSSATLGADGGSVTTTYHGNGNPRLEITLNPDGGQIRHQHTEDGTGGLIDARNADGTLVTLEYSQNGSSVTTRHPDGRIESKSTENGVVTGEYTRHVNGGEDFYRRVVGADGSVVEDWQYADGAKKQRVYYPNGKLASESAFAADRSGYLRQYAESGRLMSAASYNADGSGSETTYLESGETSTREWNGTPPTELRPWTATAIAPDGTTTLTHHRADGSIERIEIRRPDGSVKITDYHPNGTPVQIAATNFTDEFAGSALSDTDHRASQRPEGDGFRFTATPASYVARFAGTGQMVEQMLTYADGSINAMNYYADGRLAEETRSDLDGTAEALAFYINGNKALRETIDADGALQRVRYHANGHVAEQEARDPEGQDSVAQSATHRSDGSLIHQRIERSDGSVVELSQLANGASVRETQLADGSMVRVSDDHKGNERTIRFDPEGRKLREDWKRPDGTWGFDEYAADGSSRGSTVSAEFRSNYLDDGRGNRTETLFDTASDARLGERRRHPDGSVTTTWVHAGGVSSGSLAQAGGNGFSWLDDGAGDIRCDYRFAAPGRVVLPQIEGAMRSLVLSAGDSLTAMSVTAIVSDASGEPALLLSLGNGRELVLEGALTGSEDRFVSGNGQVLDTAALLARVNVLPATIETAAGQLLFSAADGVVLEGGDAAATVIGWGKGQTLAAGTGTSRLIDGTGSATFVVLHEDDEVVQLDPAAGGGTVCASVSYSLAERASGVANLTLTGGSGLTAVGNDRDNVLTASDAGSLLDGGGGRDTLIGGAGGDVFLFGLGSGEETVIDGWQAGDRVRLREGLSSAHVTAARARDDLVLGIVGAQGDSMRLKGYFAAGAAGVVIEDAAGEVWTAAGLLEAAASNPRAEEMAVLQKSYVDGIRNGVVDGLLANQGQAYALQPDGSYLSKTFFYGNELRALSAPNGGYRVEHEVSYLDGRSGAAFVTQDSWIPYAYHGLQPGSSYDAHEPLSNTSVVIETHRAVANAAQVTATAPVVQTDRWEQKWVRVDWQSGQWKSTANQVVPVTDAVGAVIGFDKQTIISSAPWALEYRGTARGGLLDSPGNLTTGVENAQVTPLSFAHHTLTHTIETLYLGDDTQAVSGNAWTVVNAGGGISHIRNAGFVYAGSGNHVVENARIAYGGSGNTRFVGGDTVHAGSGDDLILGARTVVAGGGDDRVIVSADGVLKIYGEIQGVTRVSGAGLSPAQVLDRFYQHLGIAGWNWCYEHAGETYYLLSHPDFGFGAFASADEALAELRRNGAGTLTLQQAIDRRYLLVDTVRPLPVLATVPGLGVEPSAAYAAQGVSTVHLAANDFATLAEYGVDRALDSVRFESDVTLADLHFSWTQAMVSMDGLQAESRHAALRISWGSESAVEVLIPHADDPVGSAIGFFRFGDGETRSLGELIAMAPPAPDFDPHLFKFGPSAASSSILVGDYEGLQLSGSESAYVLGREGDDLRVRSVASGRDLVISGWFAEASAERPVRFDGGRLWGGTVLRRGSDEGDIAVGGAAAESFDLLAGDDRTFAGAGNDHVAGGEGNDFLAGGEGHDMLEGGAGTDQLYGDGGNDFLHAGPDGGFLQGGRGNDTYLFERGDGTVTLDQRISPDDDRYAGGGDVDVVRFGEGISAADLRLSYDAQSATLKILIGSDGDAISIIGWRASWSADYARQIARFEFADGTVWTDASIPMPVIEGGEGDDQLAGTIGDDMLSGNAGNDALSGLGGNDRLSGGSGNDSLFGQGGDDIIIGDDGDDGLYGGEGDDSLDGGDGRDFLLGEAGRDRLSGGDGDDYLYGFEDDDSLNGGDANDYLDGGAGNDTMYGSRGHDRLYGGSGDDLLSAGAGGGELQGGAGNDVYLVERGDGVVSIRQVLGVPVIDESGTLIAGPGEFDAAASDVDVVRFGAGIAAEDIVLSYDASSSSLRIAFKGTDDIVQIIDWAQETSRSIARYEFADGTVWTPETMPLLSLAGTEGGDWLTGSHGRDSVNGGNGNDYLFGLGGADVMHGDNGDDYLDGGAGDDVLSGGAGFDWLYGGDGNDILSSGVDGGGLIGGAGDDVYHVDRGDGEVRIDQRIAADAEDPLATQHARAGDIDVIRFGSGILPSDIRAAYDRSQATLRLSLGGEDSVLVTGWHAQSEHSAARNISRFEFADGTVWLDADLAYLVQNQAPVVGSSLTPLTVTEASVFQYTLPADAFSDPDADDVLTYNATLADGSALPAWLTFDGMTQTFSGVPESGDVGHLDIAIVATDTAGASVSQQFLLAVEAAAGIPLVGTAGNDVLTGTHRNETIDGGAGRDRMVGGAGNDTYYVDNSGDTVVEFAGEGTDTVISTVSLTLAANVENLNLAGSANISGVGNALDNVLNGNTGNNTLNGGLGVDAMIGGVGNDTYYVDNPGDVVAEVANEGTDRVVSTVSYTLGDNVENLTLSGSEAISGTGNELNNTIIGNAAENVLSGLGGNDSLTGGDSSDMLLGGAGNDTLNGGLGGDSMAGGADNDNYYVDNLGDVVTEFANEGTDRIISTVSYTLGDNVENLTLSGSEAISGTGNTLANSITGNAAANLLDGGDGNDSLNAGDGDDALLGGAGNDAINGAIGADSMAGGADNDTYYVDNTGDVVTELLNEGTDRVISTISYTLGENLENLTLSGTSAISGTGNELNNTIVGNAAENVLSGLGGNDSLTGGDSNDLLLGGTGNDTLNGGLAGDTMAGGADNDTYYVDNAGDVVTELFNEGTDRVIATISYTLGENFENLTLSGSEAIDGTGNALANSMTGNAASNLLNGGDGNDTENGAAGIDFLEGMAGNDTLSDTSGSGFFNGGAGADRLTGSASADFFIGGSGNDTITTGDGNDIIVFNGGDGQDTIAAGGAGSDTLSLGGGIDYADLVFRKSSNDLVLKTGGTDQITFKNWYAATPSKPVLNLQMIAEAMAGFEQGGSDPLKDQKVENFNFAGLAGAFDAARVANPGLTSWALTNALTSFQLAGSDTAAIGGDLAYQYGKNGTLAGIGMTSAQQVIGDAGFGTQAQTLRPLATIQEGAVRLS